MYLYRQYDMSISISGHVLTRSSEVSRNKKNPRVVVFIITALYALNIIGFIIQWWAIYQWMVVNGATRFSIFRVILLPALPVSVDLINSFSFYLTFAVADTLLVSGFVYSPGELDFLIRAPDLEMLQTLGQVTTDYCWPNGRFYRRVR